MRFAVDATTTTVDMASACEERKLGADDGKLLAFVRVRLLLWRFDLEDFCT